ncbi:Gamma-secretase subunit APH-1A [Thelohanellus kitauei]|uniref:Gamma-secretase subunit APH-1A n=1 Tax=Thelohanellus kitauei TaxID=669202 RepID=A0A0C2JJW2_THEKT|nr:Gamma-secretase subunit APH-1A [Thelohanellus kitauei]
MPLESLISGFLSCMGPGLSLYLPVVVANHDMFLVSLISFFMYIFSLILSSVVWSLISISSPSIFAAILFSVIFQEVGRAASWFVITVLDRNFFIYLRDDFKLVSPKYAYMNGLSFGISFTILNSSNYVRSLWGDGDVQYENITNDALTAALINFLVIVLNISWSLMLFKALNERKYIIMVVCYVSHFLMAWQSKFHNSKYGIYVLAFDIFIMIATSIFTGIIMLQKLPPAISSANN